MEGTPFPPAGAREMRSLFKGRREHTQPPCNSRDHPGARGYAGATLAAARPRRHRARFPTVVIVSVINSAQDLTGCCDSLLKESFIAGLCFLALTAPVGTGAGFGVGVTGLT